jgi:hypothetical protein
METVVEQLPTSGTMNLKIQVSTTFNFSAVAARRKVGRYIAEEIGYLLRSGEPKLVVSERIAWRVPVILALPTIGPIGEAGAIDVDVETGKLNLSPDLIASITQNGERLAAGPVASVVTGSTS